MSGSVLLPSLRGAFLTVLLSLGLVACASPRAGGTSVAVRALPEEGPVAVSWGDPASMAERSRLVGSDRPRDDEHWLYQLAQHLRDTVATRLGDGERAEIRIVDAARAGSYEAVGEPTARRVRVVRDVYAPMLDIELRRIGADGAVQDLGLQRLRDPGFLMHSGLLTDRDGLRFEKRMIERWAQQEFGNEVR